ncbi:MULTISPECIES: aminoacyl-tRNA hydrolase [unclassified Pseudomonas]|uniref:aminoacyl-tRNA hydrolase n=1 Tax=unclassified Pseudomonas TaxID=196821 RepID=UPI000BD6A30D|nr:MULTISPECIES: aminoacyl-tRNA hydrolase [unclassified Pseudomonas]PVZ15934.1 PTH1 family peptidyl-tRNA hydrolase [Pseudomonas sp. URIL14HWK12:I12]PVZ26210.1 PTH1 family peptidyl-tRNA hydrolase [Pseudomonas sp. URIL14HWK12:I10]PVZ36266.1 PTH1 family peptidyl-tRNA hydrolase [Pseudomonas sp. URIL14HWK12:I11]SNZ18291.1 peptidyl-tRNA hydrolase [Pseudomonas sp. URIL14HWK12:I9]
MTAIQLIVGLGNPGPEYEQTRHNAGALFVERIARDQNVNLAADRKYSGLVGRFSHKGQDVRLLIPTTYMNRSGQSVGALANFFRIPVDAILVAHDELDMPPGVAKLKQGGGHGGHNGLRDIIASLGNNNGFHRLRLGIGHPGDASKVSGFVLGRAPREEQDKLDASIDFALGVLPTILAGDWPKAMRDLHSQKA